LANDIIVYPAHGAGSSCGKNLGAENFSTIGDEKQNNYALQKQTKEAFIKSVTADLEAAPKYFSINAQINKDGYDTLEALKKTALVPLNIEAFKKKINEDAIILDTRPNYIFTQGFIPGSIFIGLEGRFAEWAGNILPFDKPIILVTEIGKEEETVVRLARVGFDKIEGYLKGGFETWQNANEAIDLIIDIDADELAMDIKHDTNIQVVDVRRETEFADGHITDAINLPLSDLTDVVSMAAFEDNQNIYLHCGAGYRSVIAASLFKRQGLHNVRNVTGGWNAIKMEKNIKTKKETSALN
jgi:rhodanese-related sulfurtransferase